MKSKTLAHAFGLLAGLLVLVFTASPASNLNAQFAGRVSGIVVNGTPGGTVPPGFEVVLLTTDLDGKILGQMQSKVDQQGVFEFTNVLQGEDVRNRLVTDYQGVISTLRLEDEIAPANLKVEIFETTRSLASISVGNHVMVVRPDGESRLMGVLEFVTIRNTGDRTFVAELTDPSVTGLRLLRFGLPPGYEGLTGVSVDPPLPQGQLVEVGPGFALTNPVPPGEFRVLFEYFVRYEGGAFEFSRNLPFGASEFRVLLVKAGGAVRGDGLESLDEVTLGNSVYSVVRGGPYPRDSRMTIRFSDLPQPSLWQSLRNSLQGSSPRVRYGVSITAGAVMAALLVYVFWRRRRKPEGPAAEEPALRPAEGPDRQRIVREIASLDQRFEAGEIEEVEYRRWRQKLTEQALGHNSGQP